MQPTTLRLRPNTIDKLDTEYVEYGYRDRSEYIRHIIENRSVVVENTEIAGEGTPVTSEDYDQLETRVDELEQRLSDLEGQSSDEQSIIEYVKENQPVSRTDILSNCVPDDYDGKPDSWWRRHGREKLEEAGGEFTRNVGWEIAD